MKERLIFQDQLKEIVPFGRTTIWRLERDGLFSAAKKGFAGSRRLACE